MPDTNIISPRVPLVDPKTGLVSREWFRFFATISSTVGNGDAVSWVNALGYQLNGETIVDTNRNLINIGTFNGYTPVGSINGKSGLNVALGTDDVSEGLKNLYFTNARAAAAAPVQTVFGRKGAVTLQKNDVTGALGYTPVNKAGDTLSGKLNTMAPTANGAGLNLAPGVSPISPVNGDVWATSGGLFAQVDDKIFNIVVSAGNNNDTTFTNYGDIWNDLVVSGLLPTVPGSASLTMKTPTGIAYVKGIRLTPNPFNYTYQASKDTYVDLDNLGSFHYSAVANNAAAPGVYANSTRLFKTVTNATQITSVTDLRNLTLSTSKNVSVGNLTATNFATGTGQVIDSANNWQGVTIPVTKGGTGATTAAQALTNLGAAPLASPSFSGHVTIPAATTTTSGLTLTPSGYYAPSSPNNGDLWSITSNLLTRLNGSTFGLVNPYGDLWQDGVIPGTGANGYTPFALYTTLSGSTIVYQINPGVGYVKGIRVFLSAATASVGLPSSQDSYLDLRYDGAIVVSSVATNAPAPAVATNSMRLFKVAVNATPAVTGTTDYRNFQTQPVNGLITPWSTFGDNWSDMVVSGLFPTTIPSASSSPMTTPAGVAYVMGVRVHTADTNQFYNPGDNYVDLDNTGQFHVTNVPHGNAAPAVYANSIRLFMTYVTSTVYSSVTDMRQMNIVASKTLQAPTVATGDNSTSVATTAWVKNQGYAAANAYLPLTGGTLSGQLSGTYAYFNGGESHFANGTYTDPVSGVGYAVKVSQGIAADNFILGPTDGYSLNARYNNTTYQVVRNHNNGNITVNSAGATLFLGWQNTTGLDLMNGKGGMDSNGLLWANYGFKIGAGGDGLGYGFWNSAPNTYGLYMSAVGNASGLGGDISAESDYNIYLTMGATGAAGKTRGFVFKTSNATTAAIKTLEINPDGLWLGSGWYRVKGTNGIYWQDQGTGLYSDIGGWVKTYNNAGLYVITSGTTAPVRLSNGSQAWQLGVGINAGNDSLFGLYDVTAAVNRLTVSTFGDLSLLTGAYLINGATAISNARDFFVNNLYSAGNGQKLIDPSGNATFTGTISCSAANESRSGSDGNGYAKLPSGLIIQWGTNTSTGTGTITFPTAFPHYCMQVVVGNGDIGANQGVVGCGSMSTSSFQITCSNANIFRANWIAIGY